MTKRGGTRSMRTTWRTIIISLPTSTAPTGISAGMRKLARFGFVLGWLASEQAKPVEWKPGDEFETARKKSEKSRE